MLQKHPSASSPKSDDPRFKTQAQTLQTQYRVRSFTRVFGHECGSVVLRRKRPAVCYKFASCWSRTHPYWSQSSLVREAVTISQGASLQFRTIVVVHVLNGHRKETWTGDKGILWLRDLLPSRRPNARIWTWGYDSRSHTKSYREHHQSLS